MKLTFRWLVAFWVCFATTSVAADVPTTQPRAARSVHLAYSNPFQTDGCAAFCLDVTVEKTTPGSYFEACGFNHGYFGIQELAERSRVAIFSVWDPPPLKNAPTTESTDAPITAPPEQCEVLYSDKDARIMRFGGEGTGAQCMYDYDWTVAKPVRFYLSATADDNKTTYAAYIQMPRGNGWKHLATFRTRTDGKLLLGLYSFLEDFRRDTVSAGEVRRAIFSNPWVQDSAGVWKSLVHATFTGSNASWEAKDTVDAGVRDNQFFLQTGGNTVMHRRIGDSLDRRPPPATMPASLPLILPPSRPSPLPSLPDPK